MYVDNIKKLHNDLKKLIFVSDNIETADADGQGYDLDNILSIINKWLNLLIWNMKSDEFRMHFGEWEDKDLSDVFWPYADTVIEMKDKLRTDYNKLVRIYYRLKEELKSNKI